MKVKKPHFLITCFPVQGHINPALQLAKNLAGLGAAVTFATTSRGFKAIKDRLPDLRGLSYASFSDGLGDEITPTRDYTSFMTSFQRSGSQGLTEILLKSSHDGRPVTCLVYSLLMPWASAVARDMHVPSAFLAIQCAAAFAIYRRIYSPNDGLIVCEQDIDSMTIEDLPTFTLSDLPTFVLPQDRMNSFMKPMMLEHVKELERGPTSLVFLNTFQELEQEGIRDLEKTLNVVPIGPLIPSAYLAGDDNATDKSFGGDLHLENEDDYFKWLDSKEEKTVVYVAFGSLVVLSKEQTVEILHALAHSERPFLWVLRSLSDGEGDDEVKNMVEIEMKNCDGLIVKWCSQTEVLSHKSVGCFVTHCGWNSTLDSIVCGVPLVACPHYSDQTTNAKLVDEVWGNGVRARLNGEVVMKREELKLCLDVVMGEGERGEEIRENALKLREMAIQSVKDGGSTYNNLRKVMETF